MFPSNKMDRTVGATASEATWSCSSTTAAPAVRRRRRTFFSPAAVTQSFANGLQLVRQGGFGAGAAGGGGGGYISGLKTQKVSTV